MTHSGQALDVTVTIQGYIFTSSFLLLLVPKCDLLLGAQWLDNLGFIGWHFLDKVMVFWQEAHCHVLQGLKPTPSSTDHSTLMSLLSLEQFGSTSAAPGPNVPPSTPISPPLQNLLACFVFLKHLPNFCWCVTLIIELPSCSMLARSMFDLTNTLIPKKPSRKLK